MVVHGRAALTTAHTLRPNTNSAYRKSYKCAAPLYTLAPFFLLCEAASSSEAAMPYCLHTSGSTHLQASTALTSLSAAVSRTTE